jgi:hypothetical protein
VPRLEALEDRALPSTMIDAHLLTAPTLSLDSGAATIDTRAVQTLDLAPGVHSLTEPAGSAVSFSVASDGTVNFDPSLDGILSGRGTATLGVNGRAVTLNVGTLSFPLYLYEFVGLRIADASVSTVRVLPGPQLLLSPGGFGGEQYFTVANDGTVSYDPSLEGAFTGAGTSTLGVNGRAITLNVGALSEPFLYLDEISPLASASVFTAHVLPGAQLLEGPGVAGGDVVFTVANDGTVSYDPSLEGVLTGASTDALGINGLTVTLNVGALSDTYLSLDYSIVVPTTNPSMVTARVLPGPQLLLGPGDYGGYVTFTVAEDGTVGYDPTLEGALTGAGTDTLGIVGRTIIIDATALTVGGDLNFSNTFRTDAPFTATVLPGPQLLRQGLYSSVTFTVANDGTVDYSNPLALSDALEGRGTMMLTLKGETIHIDATALSGVSSTFTIAGVGTFDATTVQTLTVLPGLYQFQAGTVTVDFEAELFNMVYFDLYQDATVASGFGTDTLRLLPPM